MKCSICKKDGGVLIRQNEPGKAYHFYLCKSYGVAVLDNEIPILEELQNEINETRSMGYCFVIENTGNKKIDDILSQLK